MNKTLFNMWQFFFRHPRNWVIPTAKLPPPRKWTELEQDCVKLHISQATNLRRLGKGRTLWQR